VNTTTCKQPWPGDKSAPLAAEPASEISAPNAASPDPRLIRAVVEEMVRQIKSGKMKDDFESPMIGYAELSRRLPMYGDRDLREKIKRGLIPAIRPKGCRKWAFFWPGVVEALRRYEQGGIRQ
jgi:hypothetical protein